MAHSESPGLTVYGTVAARPAAADGAAATRCFGTAGSGVAGVVGVVGVARSGGSAAAVTGASGPVPGGPVAVRVAPTASSAAAATSRRAPACGTPRPGSVGGDTRRIRATTSTSTSPVAIAQAAQATTVNPARASVPSSGLVSHSPTRRHDGARSGSRGAHLEQQGGEPGDEGEEGEDGGGSDGPGPPPGGGHRGCPSRARTGTAVLVQEAVSALMPIRPRNSV